MSRRRLLHVAVAAALVLAGACGRKGAPLPPILTVPETTTDLSAYQDGEDVVLNWSYPQLTRSGNQLTDLAQVEVWRLQLPPGQEQVGEGPAGDELRRQLMLAHSKLVARLEGPSLQAATRGSSLTYREVLPSYPAGSSPPTLWFAVRSRRKDGTPSALSNIVTWQPRPIPPRPQSFTAKPQKDGIALSWAPVPGFTYVVERKAAAAAPWTVVSPIGIEEPSYFDGTAEQGQTWWYRVRSFLKLAASPPTAALAVPYPDVYPPPPVGTLVCLPEPGLVRLRWEASPETDVRYKIFRRVGKGDWEHLEEAFVPTEYIDAHPPVGEVEYAVKAVDHAGNQSDAAYCTARMGP